MYCLRPKGTLHSEHHLPERTSFILLRLLCTHAWPSAFLWPPSTAYKYNINKHAVQTCCTVSRYIHMIGTLWPYLVTATVPPHYDDCYPATAKHTQRHTASQQSRHGQKLRIYASAACPCLRLCNTVCTQKYATVQSLPCQEGG